MSKLKYPRSGQIVLVLDPSSEHLGWSVMKLDSGTATITNSGMLYASSSWPLGRRLHYMYKSLKYLIGFFKIQFIVTEDFVIPKFRQSGITVIPTINNNLKMLIWELGNTIDLNEVSTTTWRKNLGISANPALDKKGQLILNSKGKSKKDWKVPCRTRVEEVLGLKLPKTLLANTNLKERVLPHDVSDCLGIALAEAISLGYPRLKANPDLFTNSETIQVIKTLYTLIEK